MSDTIPKKAIYAWIDYLQQEPVPRGTAHADVLSRLERFVRDWSVTEEEGQGTPPTAEKGDEPEAPEMATKESVAFIERSMQYTYKVLGQRIESMSRDLKTLQSDVAFLKHVHKTQHRHPANPKRDKNETNGTLPQPHEWEDVPYE